MSNHRDPVPQWLNERYLQDILRNYLKDDTLEVNSIEVNPGSSVGDNYCCQIFRITVNLHSNNQIINNFSLIGKLKPSTSLVDELEKTIDLFEVEANFFTTLQPKLNDIINGIENMKEYTPKCYHVDLEHSIILMEDLKVRAFEQQKRRTFLNLDQTGLVMEALGTLHGVSMRALKKYPNLREIFRKYIWGKEVSEPTQKLMKNGADSLAKHVNSYGLPDRFIKKLLNVEKETADGILEVVDVKEGKLNVLCHGDCWMNNMMFHYKNGVPDDVTLFDFQIVNYNSLANDLHYFLFSSVKAEVLATKLDYLLEKYFQKLAQTAPEDLKLTFERVKSEFIERSYFGYAIGIFFRPFIVAETPIDLDSVLIDGKLQDNGFNHPAYIRDLQILLLMFEKFGVIC